MPRNDTGQYSLAVSSFVPFTRILNTAMNSVLVDIANNITQSMPPNGVVPMTGPLRLQDGTLTDLAIRFESDPDNGFYTSGAGSLAMITAGAVLATILDSGNISWTQSHTFSGSGFFSGAVSCDILTVATEFNINGREVTSFASGTVVPIFNAAAPTSWTQVAVNDFTFRVMSTGGVSGGTLGWSVVAAKTTFDNTNFSLASHNHTFQAGVTTGGAGAGPFPLAFGTNSGATIPTLSSGTSSTHNHTLNMVVQYLDLIICSKN